jgi:hypothetical protein
VDDDLATGEDTPVAFTGADLLSNDSDPDLLPLAIDSIDAASMAGGTIASLGGDDYQYTPPAGFSGDDTFTYTNIDGAATTAEGTVTVTVAGEGNDPPVVTNPGPQDDPEGASILLPIAATDPESDPLTYSATGLPPNLSINASTGQITGTITQTAEQNSPYNVTVTVTEVGTPDLFEDSETFEWTVNRVNVAPVLTQPADQSDLEGATITPLPIVATDADGDVLEFSAVGLPPGLTIDADTGVITGAIDAGTTAGSPYMVTVTVTDPDLLSDEVAFTWNVNNLLYIFLPIVGNDSP